MIYLLIKGLKRTIGFCLYTLYFNFKVLPLRQALKFPFYVYIWPTIMSNKGKVVFDNSFPIKKGMIRIGAQRTPVYREKVLIWRNDGTVVFKGLCRMGHHIMIMVRPGAYLEFGDQTAFNSGCRIGCKKKIIFGNKVKVSWDCQFYDTDFHAIIDMVRGKPLKVTIPIFIGDEAWIGHNVIVCKGVKIANGIIVGAGSVVKNSFSTPNCIVAGNPAEMIDEGFKPVFKFKELFN